MIVDSCNHKDSHNEGAPALQVPRVTLQEGVKHTTRLTVVPPSVTTHEICTGHAVAPVHHNEPCLLYSHYLVSLVQYSTVRTARSEMCSSCTQELRYGESYAKHVVTLRARVSPCTLRCPC